MPAFHLPVAVCVLPEKNENVPRGVRYPQYIHEILAHAGFCYENLAPDQLDEKLKQEPISLRVLVTIGEAEFSEESRELLKTWIEQGGAWLSIAGMCGCVELFGAAYAEPAYRAAWGSPGACTLGEGYLAADEKAAHPILGHLQIPLHFYNGLAVSPIAAWSTPGRGAEESSELARMLDVHGRKSERAGIIENQVGRGRCVLIAPDAVGAIQYIQQGIAVTRDGVPAPDGTAPVSDGVLKSDDGMVLDWHFDRQEVPGVPGLRGFLEPIADAWREVILRALFYLAQKTATPLPLLWLYPRNLPAIAHMSHDSDNNIPERAHRLLELLAQSQIVSTWCIIAPGYERELIERIREEGHELAMHYDAMSKDCRWSERLFDEQWKFLCDLFGENPVSNKNHYTRWEGDTEFFDWCRKRGIQLDQSKAVSKTGESGFNFGTCHLYFPLAPDGKTIDVLELATPTQDLEVFAPTLVGHALLAAAVRHHGVLHVLFHPGHTHKDEVGDALLEIVAEAKKEGLEWWTASALNTWERARRATAWNSGNEKNDVKLRAAEALPDATILILRSTSSRIAIDGAQVHSTTVSRWGFEFEAVTQSLQSDVEYLLTLSD